MDNLISNAVLLSAALIPLITALVELFKQSGRIEGYESYVSVVIGIILGLVFGKYLGEDLFIYVLTGLISGLSASGLYDNIDNTIEKYKGDD